MIGTMFSFYLAHTYIDVHQDKEHAQATPSGRLRHEGGGGGGLVLPVGGQHGGALVVAGQAVNARLDENQAVLGVDVLVVLLQVLAHVHSLLDQVVQILGQLGRQT